MKRIVLVILMFLLIIFFCPSEVFGEYKLKYDFQYLVGWVARKMEITIDSNKPEPKLKILPEEEILIIYEKKNGKYIKEKEKNGKKIETSLKGFYRPSNFTSYVASETTESGKLEEAIIHELVHYFQHVYSPSQNLTCLEDEDIFPYRNCPHQREACRIEKLFRLERGLVITDLDLECFANP